MQKNYSYICEHEDTKSERHEEVFIYYFVPSCLSVFVFTKKYQFNSY